MCFGFFGGLVCFFFHFLEFQREQHKKYFCHSQQTQDLEAITVPLEGIFKTLLVQCFLNLFEYSTPAPQGASLIG